MRGREECEKSERKRGRKFSRQKCVREGESEKKLMY